MRCSNSSLLHIPRRTQTCDNSIILYDPSPLFDPNEQKKKKSKQLRLTLNPEFADATDSDGSSGFDEEPEAEGESVNALIKPDWLWEPMTSRGRRRQDYDETTGPRRPAVNPPMTADTTTTFEVSKPRGPLGRGPGLLLLLWICCLSLLRVSREGQVRAWRATGRFGFSSYNYGIGNPIVLP